MQTYVTVSCKKSSKIERNRGVHRCYVCGALTNAVEIIFEEVVQHNPYNNPRGPVYSTFERELEKHPVCLKRFETWHSQIDKTLQVIFGKDRLEVVDRNALTEVAAILKKNRAKRWCLTENDDLKWDWISPVQNKDLRVWREVLNTLHG